LRKFVGYSKCPVCGSEFVIWMQYDDDGNPKEEYGICPKGCVEHEASFDYS
jgi:hypothetical protein